MLSVAPAGFEERETPTELELAAYVQPGDEMPVLARFPAASVGRVEAGWEERWRRFHRPVRIGRLWVGPPWERPPADAPAVVIDPGRAFGTGSHPTTRLSLALLDGLPRGSLVDLGCGSGVLAIAGARLGFGPVLALDLDPAAVEATRANAAANSVEVEARQADVLTDELPTADVAVANIALAAVEALASRVRAARFVTSGYLSRDRLRARGWSVAERRADEGWAAHVLARESD